MSMLILGAGKHQRVEGATHVDIIPFEGIDVVTDLNDAWPFKDDSYTHVSAVHVIEHLFSLVDFMNEAWRVLQKGGTLYCITPYAGIDNDLCWSDPTHVRFYTKWSIINYFTLDGIERFGYTDKPWAILKIGCIEEGENKNCLEFLVTPLK